MKYNSIIEQKKKESKNDIRIIGSLEKKLECPKRESCTLECDPKLNYKDCQAYHWES